MRDTYRGFYGGAKDQNNSSRYSEEQFRAAINRPNLTAGEALAARFRSGPQSHDQNAAPSAHHSSQRNGVYLPKDLTKTEKDLRGVLRARQAAANDVKPNQAQVVKSEPENAPMRRDEKGLENQVKLEDQADQVGKSILGTKVMDEENEQHKKTIERLHVASSPSHGSPCPSSLPSSLVNRPASPPETQTSATAAASSRNPAPGPGDVTEELHAAQRREAFLQRSHLRLLSDYKDVKAGKRKAEDDLEEAIASKRRLKEDLARERRYREEAEDDFADAKEDCRDLEDAIDDYKKKIREGNVSRKALEDKLRAAETQSNDLQARLLQSQRKTASLESAAHRAIDEWDALLTKERAATAAASARLLELQATFRVIQSLIGRSTSQDVGLSVPATGPQSRMDVE